MEWNAENYRNNSSVQTKNALALLDQCNHRESDSILDIGSGDGSLAKYLSEKVPKGTVLGIDPSDSMVSCARKAFGSQGSNLFFEQRSCYELSQVEGEFDLITAFSCIHWFEDISKVFKDIQVKLVLNGTFLAVTYPRNELFWSTAETITRLEEWRPFFQTFRNPFHFRTKVEYEHLLKESFFEAKVVEECNPMWFNDLGGFMGHTLAWLPQVNALPTDSLKQTYCRQFCTQYIEALHQNLNGKVWIPCETLFISARKAGY